MNLGERVGLESPWVARSRERMRAIESALKASVVSPDDPDFRRPDDPPSEEEPEAR